MPPQAAEAQGVSEVQAFSDPRVDTFTVSCPPRPRKSQNSAPLKDTYACPAGTMLCLEGSLFPSAVPGDLTVLVREHVSSPSARLRTGGPGRGQNRAPAAPAPEGRTCQRLGPSLQTQHGPPCFISGHRILCSLLSKTSSTPPLGQGFGN